MKYRVLITAPPILPSLENYREEFEKHNAEVVVPPFEVKEQLSEKELHVLLKDIDGILCGDDKLSRAVLENATRLKVISKWGTGIDSIDAEAAKELGKKVFRIEDVFTDPVADTVLAYILFFSRKILEKDRLVKNGSWGKVKSFSLREQSLGVIGVGHIGKAVVHRAAAFGMTIYCCDIQPISQEFMQPMGLKQFTLEDTLSHADFVSLNCDLNNTSYQLINWNTLKLMKPGAFIINTSRGAVIDETALIEALTHHRIGGAALDVFEVEPLPNESVLRTFENVMLSPHNSNGSVEVFRKVDQIAIRNVLSGLSLS